jgi:hypothetical protein
MGHIQIRNVPEDLHRKLKARAAEAGMSLSDYLLAELEPLAELPTLQEWVREVRGRPVVRLERRPAEVIREEREHRERELVDRFRRVRRD